MLLGVTWRCLQAGEQPSGGNTRCSVAPRLILPLATQTQLKESHLCPHQSPLRSTRLYSHSTLNLPQGRWPEASAGRPPQLHSGLPRGLRWSRDTSDEGPLECFSGTRAPPSNKLHRALETDRPGFKSCFYNSPALWLGSVSLRAMARRQAVVRHGAQGLRQAQAPRTLCSHHRHCRAYR